MNGIQACFLRRISYCPGVPFCREIELSERDFDSFGVASGTPASKRASPGIGTERLNDISIKQASWNSAAAAEH